MNCDVILDGKELNMFINSLVIKCQSRIFWAIFKLVPPTGSYLKDGRQGRGLAEVKHRGRAAVVVVADPGVVQPVLFTLVLHHECM